VQAAGEILNEIHSVKDVNFKPHSKDSFVISSALSMLEARILTASLAQRVNMESTQCWKLAETELELVVKGVRSIAGILLFIFSVRKNTGLTCFIFFMSPDGIIRFFNSLFFAGNFHTC